jgi:exodeoxyribonuclease VII large subunit
MLTVLKVSEITSKIKHILEKDFSSVAVIGEVSNFKAHVSGHWYFTLKDSDSQISCTMWRSLNKSVTFTPQDGLKIIVTGKISVYPPRGSYQIDVRSIKPAGEGELQAAFEKLKKKLAAEGLFDSDKKKSLNRLPKKIGIVTASDGAAFKDMISVAARRFPAVELIIYPSKVQGEGAKEEIVRGIQKLNSIPDIDTIIIGRGGGSIEDLWAFNEENVARAIFASKIPIISAVGHEIDYTISDFVADFRAPTPSAAMELATPNKDELFAFISDFSYTSTDKILEILADNKNSISNLLNSYGFRVPENLINNKVQLLDSLIFKIQNHLDTKLVHFKNKLQLAESIIESYNFQKILDRGFVIVQQNKSIIKKSTDLIKENSFKLKFSDNEITIN